MEETSIVKLFSTSSPRFPHRCFLLHSFMHVKQWSIRYESEKLFHALSCLLLGKVKFVRTAFDGKGGQSIQGLSLSVMHNLMIKSNNMQIICKIR